MYLYLDGEHPNVKQSRIDSKRQRDKQGKGVKHVRLEGADFKRKPKHTKTFLETAVSGVDFD